MLSLHLKLPYRDIVVRILFALVAEGGETYGSHARYWRFQSPVVVVGFATAVVFVEVQALAVFVLKLNRAGEDRVALEPARIAVSQDRHALHGHVFGESRLQPGLCAVGHGIALGGE